MKVVEARPGIARANHGRRVAGGHAARRRRREPEVLGDGKAGLELGDGKRNLVEEQRGAAEVADPGDPPADAEAGVRARARQACRDSSSWHALRAARTGSSARPTRSSQSSISTATCSESAFLEAQPDQVAPGELQELRGPGPDGHQAAARSAADSADREDRAPFLDPAEMSPAARRARRARSG